MIYRQAGKTIQEQLLVLPSKLPFISSVNVISFRHLQAVIMNSGILIWWIIGGFGNHLLKTYVIEVWDGGEPPEGWVVGGNAIN